MLIAKYTANASGVVPTFNDGYVYEVIETENGGIYTVEINSDNDFTKCSFEGKNNLLTVEYLKITSNVTSMNSMFCGCTNLTSLDVSNFDTTNVTDMAYMFQNCNTLISLDVSNFDTSNVMSMHYMFDGCNALTSLDVSNFDTSSVTTMYNMFRSCNKLTSLDLSSFNTSEVTRMDYMFYACDKLDIIGLIYSDIDTINTLPTPSKTTLYIDKNIDQTLYTGSSILKIYESRSITINLPTALKSNGAIADRLYWDETDKHYYIEQWIDPNTEEILEEPNIIASGIVNPIEIHQYEKQFSVDLQNISPSYMAITVPYFDIPNDYEYNEADEVEYFKQSFELRYPDADDVGEDYGFAHVNGDYNMGLKRLIDWVDRSTDEEFVRDFEQYFHKQYTFRYYLLVIVLGMVDNLGKNMMLDTFDHKIWIPRFYDMDTICSYDNTGQIKFDVDIEMEQGYWNTSASRLWTRIRDLFHDELVEVYKDMRANGMSYESFMSYFYDQQIAQIPQSYYNKDADVKYLPFADAYIGKAHGDGYEHLKRWLKNRLIFTDTLFDYQPSYEGDILTIRANTTETMTLEIETYTPVYQHLSWYNGQMDKKKIDGKISVSFSGKAQASTDQEILIYGGTNVKSIKGISTCNPSQLLIGSATRLTELDSSNSPILTDINSDKANLLPHVYLNTINLSNCNTLGGTLKINNSPLIKDIDISNTQITDLQLPPSLRNLEKLTLTNDIKTLSLKNVPLLTDMMIPSNIEYLCIENASRLTRLIGDNCPKLETFIAENVGFNPISQVVSKANNLKRIRLINLDIACSYTDIIKISKLIGVDKNGADAPISECVTGKVALVTCSEGILKELETSFPNVDFTVLTYMKSFTVTFVDGDGNVLYECQTLENGEAVYFGDTPTKTSTAQYDYIWKGWDRQLKPIVSDVTINATFDNILRYYTIRFISAVTLEVLSSQYLVYGSIPTEPEITDGNNAWKPMKMETVSKDMDYYTQYIPYPEDLSIFNFEGQTSSGSVISYTVSLKPNVEMPSYVIFPFEYNGLPVYNIEGSSNYSSAYQGNITSVYIPESVTNILEYAFKDFGCAEIILPSNVRYLGSSKNSIAKGCFNNCKATKLVAPGVQYVPSFTGTATYGGVFANSSLKYIILGSEEYPFKSWSDNSNASRQHLCYTSGINEGFVNLVTENGIEEDVSLPSNTFTGKSRFIYSKTPAKVGTTDDGFSYVSTENTKILKYSGTDAIATIPNEIDGVTVTSIDDSVFKGNTTVTKVTVPETVVKVGSKCFNGCSSLTSIELPNVTSLGDYCFDTCSSLTSIELPNVTSLGVYCFYTCSSLTSIELPNVTSLGAHCFNGCSSLTSIELPNVTSLSDYCFRNCSDLISMTFGYIGKPISDTSNFSTNALNSYITTLSIYVTSPSSPPTLTGSPWGATNATIVYEQA